MRSIDSNDNLRRLAAIGGAGLACAVSAGDPVALEEDDAGEKHEHGRQREGAAEERNAVAVAVMLSNVAQDGRRGRADQEWAAGTGPEWSFQRRAVGPHVVKIYTKGDLRELKSAIDPF